MKLRCELHCHSNYSRDCDVSLERLIDICKKRQINVIALTDHDEIQGALELKEIAPEWLTVIVAEEIATKEGDVIGLFLNEKIPGRLSMEETIQRIREQGGLVLLPHPFDRLRHEAVGEEETKRIQGQIDFLESFNARCVFKGDNTKAAAFAETHNIPTFVGSDAHTAREYGRALNLVEPFQSAAEFAKNLVNAEFIAKKSGLTVHIHTKLVKMKKKQVS